MDQLQCGKQSLPRKTGRELQIVGEHPLRGVQHLLRRGFWQLDPPRLPAGKAGCVLGYIPFQFESADRRGDH